jgi:predicted nucleotidyltransferase
MVDLKYDRFTLYMVSPKFIDDCLFIAVSGSHSFGWSRPQSDLDLRFVVMPDLAQLISPFYPLRNKEHMEGEVDCNYYPITNYLRQIARGNGNFLDNLFMPKLVEKKELVKSLQDIVKAELHLGFVDHCIGYAHNVGKDFLIPSRVKTHGMNKLLLMRFRELLKGLSLLEGRIEFDIRNLARDCDYTTPLDILETYLEGRTDDALIAQAIGESEQLQKLLREERANSKMPTREQSTIEVPLDEWMKEYYLGKKTQEK